MKTSSQHVIQFDWFGADEGSAYWTYQRADGQYLKADELTFDAAEHRFTDLVYVPADAVWRRVALFTIPSGSMGAIKLRGHHLDADDAQDKGTIDRDYEVEDNAIEANAVTRAAADIAEHGVTQLAVLTRAVAGDAMTLTAGERTAVATALLDLVNAIEAGISPRAALRIILASQGGKLSGALTPEIRIRNVGDTKDRIVAAVDGAGNRTAVVVDGA